MVASVEAKGYAFKLLFLLILISVILTLCLLPLILLL
jgi:hypothetical protein